MNKMKIIRIKGLVPFVLGCVVPASLWAQSEQTNSPYNEKVTVTAPYQPTIGSVSKPALSPATIDTSLSAARLDYQIISRPFRTTYPIENIKPAKILGEPIPKLYSNSIKLGIGYPLSPLAELNFGVGRSRKYEFAASYRHHSTFGKIKDYSAIKTDHTYNEADVVGRIFAEKFVTTLNISYDQKSVNCYGFNDDETVPFSVDLGDYEDASKRWYQNARGILTFKDNATRSDQLRFDAKVDYGLNLTNWKSIENDVLIDGGVSKMILEDRKSADILSVGGRFTFTDNMYRDGIKDGYWYGPEMDRYQEGNELLNAYHVEFKPNLYYKYKMLEINAELVFHIFGQEAWANITPKKTQFQFNPIVDLKLHIVDKIFTFFIGTDGGVWRNSVRSISAINPYLHPLLFNDLDFTRDKFSAYAGISGNISRNIDYKVKVSGHFLENVMSFDYFRYDYADGHTYKGYGYNDFVPVYSGNVFNLKLRGDLNFRWGDRILAHVDATYNHFDQRIYYAPEFIGNIAFKYNIVDKVQVYTGIKAYSNMKALNRYGEEETLKGCFDWSIGAEYRFIKRMTAFVDFSNIIAQRYYMWYDYPSYRFNFMAGLTFDF